MFKYRSGVKQASRERDRGRKGKGIQVFAKNREVRDRLRINGMKKGKKGKYREKILQTIC